MYSLSLPLSPSILFNVRMTKTAEVCVQPQPKAKVKLRRDRDDVPRFLEETTSDSF